MKNKIIKNIIKDKLSPEEFIYSTVSEFGEHRFMNGGCGILSFALDDIWGNNNVSNSVLLIKRISDDDEVFINRWKDKDIEDDYNQKSNKDEEEENDLVYLKRLANFGEIQHVVWNLPDSDIYYDAFDYYENLEQLIDSMEENNPSATFGFKIFDLKNLKHEESKNNLEKIVNSGLKEEEIDANYLIDNVIKNHDNLSKINTILENYFSKRGKIEDNFEKIKALSDTVKNLSELGVSEKIIKNMSDFENSTINLNIESEIVDLVIKHIMLPKDDDGEKLVKLFEKLTNIEEVFPDFYDKNQFLNIGLSAYYKSAIFDSEKVCHFIIDNLNDPALISNFVANVDSYKVLNIHNEINKNHAKISNSENYDILSSMLEQKKYDTLNFLFSEDSGQDIKNLPSVKNLKINIDNMKDEKFKYALLNLSVFEKMGKFIENKENDLFFDKKNDIDNIILQSFKDQRLEKNKLKNNKNKRMSI